MTELLIWVAPDGRPCGPAPAFDGPFDATVEEVELDEDELDEDELDEDELDEDELEDESSAIAKDTHAPSMIASVSNPPLTVTRAL